MTPFKVPPSMETFTDIRPSACEVLTIAEGGADARNALARTWISEGIPVVFETCPAVYDSMRTWLAGKLEVHPKQIGLTGSARFGSSFAAGKKGQPFGPRSDLDLFVVSEALFGALCADFYTWRDDYCSGREKADNDRARRFWKNNAKEVPGTIERGFIDVNRIPSHQRYKTAQHTADAMYRLVEKLDATPRSPSPKKASVRCYEHWGSMVSQMSLNLKENAGKHAAKRAKH